MSKKVYSLRKSDFSEKFLYLRGQPFSLADYPHMRAIYDSAARVKVLKFSRQCVFDDQPVDLANGRVKLAKDLKQGDEVIGFNEKTMKLEVSKISNVWDNGKELIYHIITRSGAEVLVTNNHPFWKVDGWCDAKDLKEGDLIGIAKNTGCAINKNKIVRDWEYKIVAYLLSGGSISNKSLGFTSTNKNAAAELQESLKELNSAIELKALPKKYKGQYRIKGVGIGAPHPLRVWLTKFNLYGCNSETKFHPDFIWDLTEDQIYDYIRIWWDTDGYISKHKYSGDYDISIGLISEKLIKGIQKLLTRVGIYSIISNYTPKDYVGTNKKVFKLRIVGQESKRIFFTRVKTYKTPKNIIFKNPRNQILGIPGDYLNKLLKQISNRRKIDKKLLYNTSSKLVTFDKIKRILEKIEIPELRKIIESDIYFDKIISIENLGRHSSTAIEVENVHTFLIDGLVTKNTAKSTTLANLMVTNSAMINHFRTLYVSPSVDQTKVFSHDRLAPVIEGSPLIKEYYLNSTLTQNVFTKQLLNGSRMFLRYVYKDADRIRGLSADENLFDETQDLPADAIPVIEETMSRSMYKRKVFAGTPKRTKGTLADYWFRSSQNEYAYKCSHCSRWNILGEDNISEHGLVCSSCKKELDPRTDHGQWVSTYSQSTPPDIEGYRVCVLHFANAPWVNWKNDVWGKKQTQPRALFFNESLALEYDDGVTPVTKTEIIACCDNERALSSEPSKLDKSYNSVIGIDYGPSNSENSFTTISVVQKQSDKYVVVYAKKFVGKESDYGFIHREIPKLMETWNATVLAADYGMGEAPNGELRTRMGYNKVIAFQHESNQKDNIRWNAKMPAYTLNRTQAMLGLFNLIKKRKIVFPKWDLFQPFADDILAIQSEFNEDLGTHKYVKIGPDDFFHATLFAVVSLDMLTGEGKFFVN